MKEEPDIIGLTLEDAIGELESAGWSFEIVITRPDRGTPTGRKMVVRFTPSGENSGVLVVACEESEIGGGAGGV